MLCKLLAGAVATVTGWTQVPLPGGGGNENFLLDLRARVYVSDWNTESEGHPLPIIDVVERGPDRVFVVASGGKGLLSVHWSADLQQAIKTVMFRTSKTGVSFKEASLFACEE